jgi:hypothetical protein
VTRNHWVFWKSWRGDPTHPVSSRGGKRAPPSTPTTTRMSYLALVDARATCGRVSARASAAAPACRARACTIARHARAAGRARKVVFMKLAHCTTVELCGLASSLETGRRWGAGMGRRGSRMRFGGGLAGPWPGVAGTALAPPGLTETLNGWCSAFGSCVLGSLMGHVTHASGGD